MYTYTKSSRTIIDKNGKTRETIINENGNITTIIVKNGIKTTTFVDKNGNKTITTENDKSIYGSIFNIFEQPFKYIKNNVFNRDSTNNEKSVDNINDSNKDSDKDTNETETKDIN